MFFQTHLNEIQFSLPAASQARPKSNNNTLLSWLCPVSKQNILEQNYCHPSNRRRRRTLCSAENPRLQSHTRPLDLLRSCLCLARRSLVPGTSIWWGLNYKIRTTILRTNTPDGRSTNALEWWHCRALLWVESYTLPSCIHVLSVLSNVESINEANGWRSAPLQIGCRMPHTVYTECWYSKMFIPFYILKC